MGRRSVRNRKTQEGIVEEVGLGLGFQGLSEVQGEGQAREPAADMNGH